MTKSFDVHFIRGAIIHATLPKIGPSTTENVQVMFKKTLSLIPENRSVYENMQKGYSKHFETPIKDLKQEEKMSLQKTDIKTFKYGMFSVFKDTRSIYHYTDDKTGQNLSTKNNFKKIARVTELASF